MGINSDSTWFSIQLKERTYPEYISWRYTGWTSRLLIETGLLFFTNHVVLWRIVDTIVWMFILYSITKLIEEHYAAQLTGCICFLFVCYNLSEMNSAGWVATINNYIWPFGCLCGMLLILKRFFQGKCIKWYIGILGVFLTILACNHEQMAAATFGILVCYIAYMIWKKRKISGWIWGYFIVTLASLAFILTCPGNAMRKTIEISAYFPEYPDLSLWNKLDIGFTSFFKYNIFEHNYLFLIFLIMLCAVIWKKQIPYWKKCMALIPVTGTIGGGYLLGEFSRFLPEIENVRNSLTKTGTYVAGSKLSILTILLYVVIATGILWQVIIILRENQTNGILLLVILGIGFGTRFMMCIAPSIWVSGNRTFLYWQIALVAASSLLWKKYLSDMEKRNAMVFMAIPAAISLIYNTVYLFVCH